MSEIVVVSGLPRSGTSMMMQMLEAGGIAPLTDAHRPADEDNPAGYLELEQVKALARGESAFLDEASGKAVKVIHALLKHLPSRHRYAVIFMMRDVREVVASQAAMLKRQGKAGGNLAEDRLVEVLQRQRDEAIRWGQAQPWLRMHLVEHRDALSRPDEVAAEIVSFLGIEADEAAMVNAIRSDLYRQRR